MEKVLSTTKVSYASLLSISKSLISVIFIHINILYSNSRCTKEKNNLF